MPRRWHGRLSFETGRPSHAEGLPRPTLLTDNQPPARYAAVEIGVISPPRPRARHGGWDDGDFGVGEWWQSFLAFERGLQIGSQLGGLVRFACCGILAELRHDFGGEQSQCFADVRVLIATRLLQQDHLVDTTLLKRREV